MSDPPSAVFLRQGEHFLPSAAATGPWGADRLHGGPVLGLLARAVERSAPDPALVVSRFTVDLFRPVPLQPLSVRVDVLRQSGRLCLLQAALFADTTEVARASALLLREADARDAMPVASAPPGPEGLPSESLMRGFARNRDTMPTGFHTTVEIRWVPRTADEPLAIWFRLPIPLVSSEQPSSLQLATALSDFANAVASIAARERGAADASFINADATLYFVRRPVGEWFCLKEQSSETERGISVAQTLLYDAQGLVGRVLQARLMNRMAGRS
jgi:acyl-CoA thioesterase